MLSRLVSRISLLTKSLRHAKPVAALAIGCAVIGLAYWVFQSNSSVTEDGLTDDDFFADVKPLGAVGVSDSASQPKSGAQAPFLLPSLSGKPVAGETEPDGPLFPNNPNLNAAPSKLAAGIETAAFTQAPPAGAKSPNANGSRVTSNQAVWLKGTIEFEPSSPSNQ